MEADTYQDAVRDVMATPEQVRGILFVAVIMVSTMLSAVGAIFSFLFTMTFFRVPEEHRTMGLGRIWLIMVPLFGVFWLFVTVKALATSFRSYFQEMSGEDPDYEKPQGDFGMRIGVAMVVLAGVAHLSALLVFTNSSVVLGIAVGVLAAGVLGMAIAYFSTVFKIRRQIPDPELEIVPDSYL